MPVFLLQAHQFHRVGTADFLIRHLQEGASGRDVEDCCLDHQSFVGVLSLLCNRRLCQGHIEPSCRAKVVVCVCAQFLQETPTFFHFLILYFSTCEVVFGGTHLESNLSLLAKLRCACQLPLWSPQFGKVCCICKQCSRNARFVEHPSQVL